MPIPSQPLNLFQRPFADSGVKQIIPDEQEGSGRASLAEGFPLETQLPLREGGVAPDRTDFNGILYMLSAAAFWQQSGGQWTYVQTLNYAAPAMVYYNGKLWWCLAANGPETGAGVIVPGSDKSVWQDFFDAISSMSGKSNNQVPVGTVINYYGTTAPEGYFACTGGSFSASTYPLLYRVLGKNTTPDLRGLFVRGYDPAGVRDPNGKSRNIGSFQDCASERVTGFIRFCTGGHLGSGGAFYDGSDVVGPQIWAKTVDNFQYSQNLDTARVVRTSSETRSANLSLLYCIKHD